MRRKARLTHSSPSTSVPCWKRSKSVRCLPPYGLSRHTGGREELHHHLPPLHAGPRRGWVLLGGAQGVFAGKGWFDDRDFPGGGGDVMHAVRFCFIFFLCKFLSFFSLLLDVASSFTVFFLVIVKSKCKKTWNARMHKSERKRYGLMKNSQR